MNKLITYLILIILNPISYICIDYLNIDYTIVITIIIVISYFIGLYNGYENN